MPRSFLYITSFRYSTIKLIRSYIRTDLFLNFACTNYAQRIVASAILPIAWVVKTSAVRDGAPRVYSYPLHAVDRTLVGLMGPPFQFMILSLLSLVTQNLSLNQWTHFSPLIHYDLMWGPNGITGRYIAMFLDNFSPFQN